jgi:hypothetical protein
MSFAHFSNAIVPLLGVGVWKTQLPIGRR